MNIRHCCTTFAACEGGRLSHSKVKPLLRSINTTTIPHVHAHELPRVIVASFPAHVPPKLRRLSHQRRPSVTTRAGRSLGQLLDYSCHVSSQTALLTCVR